MAKHPLIDWRQANGLSQEQAGETLGTTRWTINSIERGRRKPSIELTKAIEARTGIPRGELRPDVFGEAA